MGAEDKSSSVPVP